MKNKNDDMLTALLLLKDRSAYTWRWMSYANRVKFPFKVYIADGGKDDSVADILNDKSTFPNVNYEYVRYPYDETYIDFYKKVEASLSRIDTPYVAQVCNDDFSFIESFRDAVAFLEEHKDYSAYGGPVYDFVVKPGESDDRYTKLFGPLSLTGRIYPAQSLVADKAIDRVRAYLEGIVNSFLWTAVHRKDCLQNAYKKLVNVNPGDLRFSDHFIYLLTMAAGKVHAGRAPMSLHQANTKDGIGGKIARQFPTQKHWVEREGWLQDFSNIVEAVGKEIAHRDDSSVEEACESFKRFYLSLIGRRVVSVLCAMDPPTIGSEHDAELALKQFYDIKSIKEFLSNGPSVFEIKMRQDEENQIKSPSAIFSMLRRAKNKFGCMFTRGNAQSTK